MRRVFVICAAILAVAGYLLLPSAALGYQCKYQSGGTVAFASCSNCDLPEANCPQGQQCPRRTYQRGRWWTLVECRPDGDKSYSGSYQPSFSLLQLIDEVKSSGSKADNFSVTPSEVPVVNAVTADPYGNMVEWFRFESFTGNYNLVYNENENTITFNITATEVGPSMQWDDMSTGTNTANWSINGTLNLSSNTFTGTVTGSMWNSIYPESTPVEYDLPLSGNIDLDDNEVTFSGEGWTFYPFVP